MRACECSSVSRFCRLLSYFERLEIFCNPYVVEINYVKYYSPNQWREFINCLYYCFRYLMQTAIFASSVTFSIHFPYLTFHIFPLFLFPTTFPLFTPPFKYCFQGISSEFSRRVCVTVYCSKSWYL